MVIVLQDAYFADFTRQRHYFHESYVNMQAAKPEITACKYTGASIDQEIQDLDYLLVLYQQTGIVGKHPREHQLMNMKVKLLPSFQQRHPQARISDLSRISRELSGKAEEFDQIYDQIDKVN